jgi:hypothetical protein
MTNRMVEKFTCGLKPDGTAKEQGILWCGSTRGLGMRLSARTGKRTYFLLYRVAGTNQERYINIGRHGDPWRLDTKDEHTDARMKAEAIRLEMRRGIDPVAERARRIEEREKDKALNVTLREIMEHYLINRRTKHGPLRPKTKDGIRRCCEVDLKEWLDVPVQTITRNACLAKFTEMSARAPAVANLAMIYLRALLSHARELHAAEDGQYTILAVNPVTRMFKIRKPNPEKPRKTRIPLNKVGAVWAMLIKRRAEARNVLERTAVDWVCSMMLVGGRLTEMGSLKKTDVNLVNKTITLRGDVVKNHNELILPMSTVLHDILEARMKPPETPSSRMLRRRTPITSEYVFPSWGKKSPYMTDARATFEAISKVAGTHIHPHALRRTAEDIAKAVKIDSDERRQLLNHLASDVHGASYSNDPDPEVLRPAVEAIAKYIVDNATIAEAQASGANVLSFPAKAG